MKEVVLRILVIFFMLMIGLHADKISLKSGWNLVGSSVDILDIDKAIPNANCIWRYKESKWYVTSPNKSLNSAISNSQIQTFSTIDAGDGFWVNIPNDENVTISGGKPVSTSLLLYKGWNLVSLKIDKEINVSDYFSMSDIEVVFKYKNNSWCGYSSLPLISQKLQDSKIDILNTISMDEGFWVYAKNELVVEFNKTKISSIYHPDLNATFQWQLQGNIDTTAYADIYDIDLFDTNSSVIQKLHNDGKKVICYFSAGSWENWRSDKDDFPSDIIGNELDGWAGEQWVDIRSPELKEILKKRIVLAKIKGCDGVEPDNVDGYSNDTGFNLTKQDQMDFNKWLADAAHENNLSIALKNAPDLVDTLVDDFDFSISEQCSLYDECDKYSAFIKEDKPVFEIEYAQKYIDNNNSERDALCDNSKKLKFHTYIMPRDLNGSFKISCSFDENFYNTFEVGFGGSSSFKFIDDNNESVWLNSYDLIFDENFSLNDYYKNIKDYNATAFDNVQNYLKNSKFITLWLTKDWQESWFNIDSINSGISRGITPIFVYWYFGDDLVNGMPTEAEIDEYKSNNEKFKSFLDKIHGNKIVIMEPEFNKKVVLENVDKFSDIISNAIDTIRDSNSTLISLCMTDTGNRGVTQTYEKCGYENCSYGDKQEWNSTKPIYDKLLKKIDFISFQEMLSPLSRDDANPGTWDNPNPKAYTADELGIANFAKRVENMGDYLYSLYKKPVFLPYMTIATATWNDLDGDGVIDNGEINNTGFEDIASQTYSELNTTKLLQHHLFGYGVMSLFDDPRHDYGGYQYLLNDEYHIGIIKSGAKDVEDLASFGNITPKGTIIQSIFKNQ